MYNALGDIVFSGLLGFTEYTEVVESALAEHNLIGGKPRLEKTGDNLNTVDFVLHLHKSFCDPTQQFELLKSHKEAATILPLVDGAGVIKGDYLIRRVEHTIIQQAGDGSPIESDIRVSMVEYVAPTNTKKKGNAVTPVTAKAPISPIPSRPLEAAAIGETLVGISNYSKDIAVAASSGTKSPSAANQAYKAAKKGANAVQAAVGQALALLAAARKVYDNVNVIKTNLVSVYNDAQSVREIANAEDINGLLTASNGLLQSANRTASSSKVITRAAAFRL